MNCHNRGTNEILKEIEHYRHVSDPQKSPHERSYPAHEGRTTPGNPAEGWDLSSTITEGVVQGAVGGRPSLTKDTLASVDVDREKTLYRDHLAPGLIVPLSTFSLAASTDLRIALPRWCRRILLQNNSDLGGSQDYLHVRFDGAPASLADYYLRPNQERILDVYTKELHLFSASAMTVNGGATGGIYAAAMT